MNGCGEGVLERIMTLIKKKVESSVEKVVERRVEGRLGEKEAFSKVQHRLHAFSCLKYLPTEL